MPKQKKSISIFAIATAGILTMALGALFTPMESLMNTSIFSFFWRAIQDVANAELQTIMMVSAPVATLIALAMAIVGIFKNKFSLGALIGSGVGLTSMVMYVLEGFDYNFSILFAMLGWGVYVYLFLLLGAAVMALLSVLEKPEKEAAAIPAAEEPNAEEEEAIVLTPFGMPVRRTEAAVAAPAPVREAPQTEVLREEPMTEVLREEPMTEVLREEPPVAAPVVTPAPVAVPAPVVAPAPAPAPVAAPAPAPVPRPAPAPVAAPAPAPVPRPVAAPTPAPAPAAAPVVPPMAPRPAPAPVAPTVAPRPAPAPAAPHIAPRPAPAPVSRPAPAPAPASSMYRATDLGAAPSGAPAYGARRVACPRCHTILEPGMRFCRICGLEVAAPAPAPAPAPTGRRPFCHRCRVSMEPGMRFCRFCGTPVHGAPAGPAPKPACPTCGSTHPAGTISCRYCGTMLDGSGYGARPRPTGTYSAPVPKEERRAICPHCGARQVAGTINCKYCGTPMW